MLQLIRALFDRIPEQGRGRVAPQRQWKIANRAAPFYLVLDDIAGARPETAK